ncbi:uncharacterized protein FA14DRAFT_125928 [Meira miltonrushii]|uniref:ARM repeat-containing protein n=1 Tax=Meira miltonrushii TaxID=1280837 RepID=A0A316V8V2_9BASI|nr:uncharacterized protein FA14DRAFT_125928 [Meira miltonrushii]PWN32613.1 hypothetical protein FA14DRAFT_125928 [Meira miltonrushii]
MTRQAQRTRTAATRPQHNRTPSHVNGLGSIAHRQIDLLNRLTSLLVSNIRVRYDCPIETLVEATIPCLADSSGKEVRAIAYRLLRHAVVRPPWHLIRACRQRGLDLYIVRTFSRDARFTIEKEQALKLVRCIMECASLDKTDGDALISVSVIRAMCAALEHGEERLRSLYIETLAELVLHDVDLVIRSGAMRILLSAAGDVSVDIQPELLAIMLYLADMPSTRRYFRPGYDLVTCISGFTDATESVEYLRNTSLAVSMLMRSWSGLLFMCLEDQSAIKSIIGALRVNPTAIQDEIITMFITFFGVRPKLFQKCARGPGLDKSTEEQLFRDETRVNLLDSFILLFVTILLDNDIIGALVHVVQDRPQLSEKALSFMEMLTNISSARLPSEYDYQMHSLSELFTSRLKGEAQQDQHEERERASKVLSILDRFSANQARKQTVLGQRPRASSVLKAPKAPVQVDDNAFRSLCLEANVINSKDQSKWNIEALQMLFETVLVHPKRLEEAMRASKLVKRVLVFFHPFTMRYSSLPKVSSTLNQKYTKLGCTILQTLLSNPDGVRFLLEDRLIREIADCLETDIMSEQRLQDTAVAGYFELIGVLSKHPEGIAVASQSRLFTALFRIIDKRGRLDLARLMLRHLDFSEDSHYRIILSRMLAHRSRKFRVEAMQRVAEMIRQKPNPWNVRLLVNQLYDSSIVVRNLASDLLLQACISSSATLDMVVDMRPMLSPDGAQSLLLKFVSSSHGLRYLMQGDYIDREMDEWLHVGNLVYANRIEALLSQALDIRQQPPGGEWDGTVPAHFYGELIKTEEGRELLERKGHFADFAHFIVQHSEEENDVEVLMKLKSVLWAVGNIGAHRGGIQFLEGEGLVTTIVQMAENTKVSSLRGTCYFVCGLIASNQLGSELLQDAGWTISTPHFLAQDAPFGYCLPPKTFLALPPWEPQNGLYGNRLPPPKSRLERNVILHLSSLGNAIVATKASRALLKLKERHPDLFITNRSAVEMNIERAIEMFVRALHLMETQPLRQSVRRYIWELFEVKMDDEFTQKVMNCSERLSSMARDKATRAQRPSLSRSPLPAREEVAEVTFAAQKHGLDDSTFGHDAEEDEDDVDYDDDDDDEVIEDDTEDEDGVLIDIDNGSESETSSDAERNQDSNEEEEEAVEIAAKPKLGRVNGKKHTAITREGNGMMKTYLKPKVRLVGGFGQDGADSSSLNDSAG